jgi:hypothetical protein
MIKKLLIIINNEYRKLYNNDFIKLTMNFTPTYTYRENSIQK